MNRYKEQLKSQLNFIKNSCEAFDRGELEEAVRLSVCFRVLFHDKGRSTSLIKHLDKQNIKLLNSSCNKDTGEYKVAMLESLVLLSANGMEPKLGNGDLSKYTQMVFEDWWNEVILISHGKYEFSRKSLILHVAEKDGGAHVDSELPIHYETLKEGEWFYVKGGSDYSPTIKYSAKYLMYLRQIGWEVLNSAELISLT